MLYGYWNWSTSFSFFKSYVPGKKMVKLSLYRAWRPVGLWDVEAYRWRWGCQPYTPQPTMLPCAQELRKCWTFCWTWKFVSWALKSPHFALPLSFFIVIDGDMFWRKCRSLSSKTFLATIQYFKPLPFSYRIIKEINLGCYISLYALNHSRQLKL
jgi:hypothetical protein